jgi:hypothetical protein
MAGIFLVDMESIRIDIAAPGNITRSSWLVECQFETAKKMTSNFFTTIWHGANLDKIRLLVEE